MRRRTAEPFSRHIPKATRYTFAESSHFPASRSECVTQLAGAFLQILILNRDQRFNSHPCPYMVSNGDQRSLHMTSALECFVKV